MKPGPQSGWCLTSIEKELRPVNDPHLRELLLANYTGPVLLDTCVLIHAVLEPVRLSPFARTVLEQGRMEIHVSAVAAWEILLKTRKGLFPFQDPAIEALNMVTALHAHWMPVTPSDVLILSRLADKPGHKDPFDLTGCSLRRRSMGTCR